MVIALSVSSICVAAIFTIKGPLLKQLLSSYIRMQSSCLIVLRENAWHLLNYPVEPFWVVGVLKSSNCLLGKQPTIPQITEKPDFRTSNNKCLKE